MSRVLRPRRRSETGATLAELVTVMGLLTVVGAMVLSALGSTQLAARSLGGRVGAVDNARFLLTQVARELRAARPRGYCASSIAPLTTPLASCLRVSEAPPGTPDGGPVIADAPDSLEFYDYNDDTAVNKAAPVLGVPDRVRVWVDADRDVFIDRFAPAPGADYTNPSWNTSAPAEHTYVGTLAADVSSAIFGFYDGVGQTPATPGDVALVSVSTTFSYLRNDGQIDVPVMLTAGLRGDQYLRERAWNAA